MFFLQSDTAFRVGSVGKKKNKKRLLRWLAIAYNDPGSLAKCEERTFCQTGIIRSSKGYFLA
jgi:hypothetical protein